MAVLGLCSSQLGLRENVLLLPLLVCLVKQRRTKIPAISSLQILTRASVDQQRPCFLGRCLTMERSYDGADCNSLTNRVL